MARLGAMERLLHYDLDVISLKQENSLFLIHLNLLIPCNGKSLMLQDTPFYSKALISQDRGISVSARDGMPHVPPHPNTCLGYPYYIFKIFLIDLRIFIVLFFKKTYPSFKSNIFRVNGHIYPKHAKTTQYVYNNNLNILNSFLQNFSIIFNNYFF